MLILSRIIRSTQTYLFPIHLSEEIIPAAIFYATVTPLLTYFVLKKMLIDPMNEAAKQRNIEKVKETNRSRYATTLKTNSITTNLTHFSPQHG